MSYDHIKHGVRQMELAVCRKPGTETFIKCASVPSDCAEGQEFYAHDQSDTSMRRCNPNNWRIGRCLKENACALRETDCETDTSVANFVANDGACTWQRDRSVRWNPEEPRYTRFGSCLLTSGEHFCIYDPEDCDTEAGDVYKTPSETAAAGVTCDCSEVHVYGCLSTGRRLFCAVKGEGCRNTYEVWSPRLQLDNRISGKEGADCRLCKKVNTPEPTPKPTTTTKPPTRNPTDSPIKSVAPTGSPTAEKASVGGMKDNQLASANDSDGGGGDGNGQMIGIAVGVSVAAVVFVAALAYVYYVRLFKNKKHYKKRPKKSGPLPGEISLGTLDDISN